ncbi:hypothetical protein [Flavobacterium branchiophilum]|uniref:Uncharacterized protein n=1 Tax=Flavobacterium branchiophilum TaxID=55197 RepID=A0A2H3KI22_9FLAO|nr:hypothetical protein [Flavobacterium branchiophilum]PDS24111.1 hypothetical protein B0A77_08965 [Flavobacterium branchiophilum]
MIEYKHVEKLSLTKQLRYGEVAKNLQKNPVLRVPQKIVGNLSKPLIESGWDIQYYQIPLTTFVIPQTNVIPKKKQ